MKKSFNTVPFYALLAILGFATTFSGCKKDEKDEPVPPKVYRMSNIEYTEDGDTYVNKITYTADNKIQKFSEIENGVELYRSNWGWNGNEVTITEEMLEEGVWVAEEWSYVKLYYANGHVSEAQYYYHDTLSSKTTYTWNGNLLTNEAMTYYNADTIAWSYSVNYIYDGTKLISANWYTMGLLMQKQVIEYLDGKPVALKSYDHNNVLGESSALIYTNENITTINNFHVAEGVQGDTYCTETRVYDANNCANNISTACTDDYAYTSAITYEEGSSNFNDFLLINVSWISVYLFPDTFPCELAYKKKKKK
jgi:hypothetical protein